MSTETEFIEAFNRGDLQYQEDHLFAVNWNKIACYEKLSEEFIEKHQDKVSWSIISCFQRLSWEFICKFSDKLDFENLFLNENLSSEVNNQLNKFEMFK